MTKECVMPEAQHSKRAYSQLFLKKIRDLLAAQSPQGLKERMLR